MRLYFYDNKKRTINLKKKQVLENKIFGNCLIIMKIAVGAFVKVRYSKMVYTTYVIRVPRVPIHKFSTHHFNQSLTGVTR